MTRLEELLAASDAPHAWRLGLAPGAILQADPPWPEVTVESSVELEPESIRWQQATVSARAPLSDTAERFLVGRAVAIFRIDGELREIEIGDRVVVPAAAAEGTIDLSTCAACGVPLHDDAVILDGEAVCPGCVRSGNE